MGSFEDAGYRPGHSEAPVGVYVATGGVVSSYLVDRLASSSDLPGATGSVAHIGNDKDFPSTRISYKLNLTGPSINVQTACSSSLVTVHLACQAILAGECSMALAGGGTIRVPQHAGYMSVKGGIVSPDGHCRAFDADAQGTIFGSGVGVVLLKELQAAIADCDNIYAVIRGSAINNDGARKLSYTASSVRAQSRAMVEAMAVAGVAPDKIGYVECHGTGTVVGDPLEIDALTRAFRTGTDRRGFCAIGSVKTNIGHLQQTAGVAALIKTALALKNGKIPPSLNFERPNPKIDFDGSPFFVNARFRDWPRESAPRIRCGQRARTWRHERVRRSRRGAAPAQRRRDRRAGGAPLSALRQDAFRAAGSDRTASRLHRRAREAEPRRSVGHADQRADPLPASLLRPCRHARPVSGRAGGRSRVGRRRKRSHRGPPPRIPIFGTGISVRRYGRRPLSVSSGVSRLDRALCIDSARSPAATAARGAVRRARRRRSPNSRNRVHPARAFCGSGCANRCVALDGRGPGRRDGAQRRGVRRGLLRRGLHARKQPRAGGGAGAADAG